MALNSYLALKGQRTGDIKGSVTQKGHEGRIMVIACSHDVVSPRDAATGLATGKRMHKPMVITKEVDRSSPLLHAVMTNNEVLVSWNLQFFRPSPTGGEVLSYVIDLTNASIASIALRMPNNKNPDLARFETYEEISFSYQKIQWTWVDGGISAMDDWVTA